MSHTAAVAPLPSSPAAPSWPYLPGTVAPNPSAASWGNQWGTYGPYLQGSCGKGSLPSLSVGPLQTWG